MIGIITYMDIKNKHGYILGADRIEYYFEFSSLDFSENILEEKLPVRFQPRFKEKMAYAVAIFLA